MHYDFFQNSKYDSMFGNKFSTNLLNIKRDQANIDIIILPGKYCRKKDKKVGTIKHFLYNKLYCFLPKTKLWFKPFLHQIPEEFYWTKEHLPTSSVALCLYRQILVFGLFSPTGPTTARLIRLDLMPGSQRLMKH